jgi:hypothetical protein
LSYRTGKQYRRPKAVLSYGTCRAIFEIIASFKIFLENDDNGHDVLIESGKMETIILGTYERIQILLNTANAQIQ